MICFLIKIEKDKKDFVEIYRDHLTEGIENLD
jgi:hypothetical protein